MTWYTASIIISCRLREGHQNTFPVYENFTLFEAKNAEDAAKKAENYAEKYAKIDDNLQLNGKSAYWKFEGIRKLIEIRDYLSSNELDVDKPTSGVEVSYSYIEVDSEEQLLKLSTGKSVSVRYIDSDEDESLS